MRSVVHLVLYPASASGQCHRQGFLQQRIQIAQHNKSQAADGIVFWRRLSESTWKFCLGKEWPRLRKVSCAQPKSGLHQSGRAGRELSVHGGQEQGTEGWSRRVSSSLKSWKYAATFSSKTSGCFFYHAYPCVHAHQPAALTRQTITTLKELLLSLPSIRCELRWLYVTGSNGSKGEKVGEMI